MNIFYEIRKALLPYMDSSVILYGTIGKSSMKRNSEGRLVKTILINDIKDPDGNILTDHIWQDYIPHFRGLRNGDNVLITGVVKKYQRISGSTDLNLDVQSVEKV
jgi:hypothetical protein